MAGDVAQRNCEAIVVESEEVVDVTADVETGRGLVDAAELDALDLGIETWQQRPLHRVGESLLLLIEPGVLECQGSLADHGTRQFEVRGAERPARVERKQGQRPEHLARRRDRDDRCARATLQEGHEQPIRPFELTRYARVEQQRPPTGEEPAEAR